MGLLASVRPTAGSETNIYTVPSGKKAVVNVTIMNVGPTTSSGTITLGVQSVASGLVDKDYVLYDFQLDQNKETFQITGLVLTSGNNIRALTSSSNYNIHVNGIEELV